jgi:uncharacterized protein
MRFFVFEDCRRVNWRSAFLALMLSFVADTPLSAGTLEDAATARERGDYATALRLYRSLADKGDANAQFELGSMYAYTKGVQNITEAKKWLRLAAEQGHPKAQTDLGFLYSLDAVFRTGDYKEAVKWYRRAADQGDPQGQALIGTYYQTGQGVPQNYAEAARWYRLAAEQGHYPAQSALGNMYAKGEGVPRNYAEAARWYRLAAEQGDYMAQSGLGVMYAKGEGVPQDCVRAYMWVSLAAAKSKYFAKNRDVIAGLMTAAQIAEAQSLAAAWRPKTSNEAQQEITRDPGPGICCMRVEFRVRRPLMGRSREIRAAR